MGRFGPIQVAELVVLEVRQSKPRSPREPDVKRLL